MSVFTVVFTKKEGGLGMHVYIDSHVSIPTGTFVG